MKFQNLSVKRLFGRVALGLVLSMSGITIALFLVTKQTAALLTGGAMLLCALAGIFVLTQAFGKRLSQFTVDLCQTLDHMITGNEAPERPEDSETQLARIGHRLARLYQIMQENRRRVDEERQELQTLVSDISHQVKTPVSNRSHIADDFFFRYQILIARNRILDGTGREREIQAILVFMIPANEVDICGLEIQPTKEFLERLKRHSNGCSRQYWRCNNTVYVSRWDQHSMAIHSVDFPAFFNC